MIYGLPEKELLKTNKELLELHKRVITNYLIQKSLKIKKRKKFFIIYDSYISETNIRRYFYRPIKLFVYAMITDKLKYIEDYVSYEPKIKICNTELVGRLTLDKINVTFKTEYLDNYHEGTLIEDIMVNYSNLDLSFNAPDFGITGIFKSINKFQELVFYPDIKGIKGSEMFLITGNPKRK